ncbi:MAG: 5'-nucleotidase C-terminal domain-containing protein [Bacteroidales bacterium]|nr:5'-nucleotidase C-terminal domain-containing protein [Bacteroidales bacterium]
MEMVQSKVRIFAGVPALVIAAVLSASCTRCFTWEKHVVDGHRTGVTAPNAINVPEALGTVDGDVYLSPSGNVFEGGATVAVARDMIDVQDVMADLKMPVAVASRDMIKHRPESELSNYIVDELAAAAEELTGKKIDLAITNFGGIRVDIPKGEVLRDDIVSMLPFRNYICYVLLKGEDLQAVFDFLAENGVQALSRARLVVKNHKVDELLIGGEPLDPQKLYGVATVDFLLDGGDGLKIAKNARDLIITDKLIGEAVLESVRKLTAEGKPFEYHTDGRVTVINEEEQ